MENVAIVLHDTRIPENIGAAARAVMVMCYELFKARTQAPEFHIPRLACRYELENMYEELKDTSFIV